MIKTKNRFEIILSGGNYIPIAYLIDECIILNGFALMGVIVFLHERIIVQGYC